MELINRIRKNRKGFTLVEIIVVLVILAILAAFTIPTMLGFVNDAKGKSYIAEAREVYVAAQSTATEFGSKLQLNDSVLSTALSSPVVQVNGAAPQQPASNATDDQINAYNAKLASYQMNKYIGTDLTLVVGDVPTTAVATPNHKSGWTVTVGSGVSSGAAVATTTAQVKKVVYVKDNYQVTITDGNASVVKLPAAAASTN